MRKSFLLTAAVLSLLGTAAQANDGATIYNQNCAMCHVPGLANAPKFGDKAAWGPRLGQGKEALVKAALAGKNAMPARGGNPKLTDEQVAAAVEHMLAAVK
ncbi:c-type cytochrome [Ideonella livida]|uniref:Cytochrome c5 family protein n=1 Tax=Ideonella livida TaxID=2707176 RepID=A0A7C9PF41_9BURK|nr:c-type cytochrome [Ideonella livida]NDY89832.1 cytochrome c5 family protein [Ideonella livida]